MSILYKLKGGHKVEEHQLFRRTYPVWGSDELHTATYFIHREKVYALDAETGRPSRCNFSVGYLNTKYKQEFFPLDKFYEGEIGEDEEMEVADDE